MSQGVSANRTVGFIGLGIMGLPMATNLVRAGFRVLGYNRSPAKAHRLAEQGGEAAGSIADAVRDADVVFTMLPDSPDVRGVLLGDGGVFAGARAGTLVIDCSTIRPDVSRELAEEAAARGVRLLDAPVSGGEAGAIDGTLSIMVGGAAEDVAAARPVLDVVGGTITHVGPAGAGQTVKAANQLIVAGNLQLVAEALVFLEAHGVDTESAVSALAGGRAGSAILAHKSGEMRRREFTPGFRLELHHKDLGIATAAARDAGVALPVGSAVAQLVGAMVARGDGALDHSALVKLVAELSGRG